MSKMTVAQKFDKGLRHIFSDPNMPAALLKDFIMEDWVDDLDFSSLQPSDILPL